MSSAASDDVSYLRKADERLETAISELAFRRFNSCASRCYYACFQATIAALLQTGIHPRGGRNDWPHSFVQGEFNGHLVKRRHRYPSELRTTLPELQTRRHSADYDPTPVSEVEAARAVRRARRFVEAVQSHRQTGGPR
jgi:uncharacterized protein (UPF0332 family)